MSEQAKMSFELDTHMRRMQAVMTSDIAELKHALVAAAERFSDVADLIEKKNGYDPVPFLRASAERYRQLAELQIGQL